MGETGVDRRGTTASSAEGPAVVCEVDVVTREVVSDWEGTTASSLAVEGPAAVAVLTAPLDRNDGARVMDILNTSEMKYSDGV